MVARADLIYSGKCFRWVPKTLCWQFVDEVLREYHEYPLMDLPELHCLTDATRNIMLSVASLHETKGVDESYFHEYLEGIQLDDRELEMMRINDPHYMQAFDDVERMLRLLRYTYCDCEDPEHIVHFTKEVW